jgi:hypothetical protein
MHHISVPREQTTQSKSRPGVSSVGIIVDSAQVHGVLWHGVAWRGVV